LNNNNSNTGQQGPGAYQDSTALEALLGYLYLTDGERCSEVLDFFCDILDIMDEEDGIIR
jgi:23S rRNA maturation mini-RNase III